MAEAALTLSEAAVRLGVHYMTAYRYVRLGLLPAQKAGGGWRVQKRAVEMFRRGSDPTGSVGIPVSVLGSYAILCLSSIQTSLLDTDQSP